MQCAVRSMPQATCRQQEINRCLSTPHGTALAAHLPPVGAPLDHGAPSQARRLAARRDFLDPTRDAGTAMGRCCRKSICVADWPTILVA
jgi:hypothetical protein